MQAAHGAESNGLSSRWRASWLMIIAMVQSLLIWQLIDQLSKVSKTIAWLDVFFFFFKQKTAYEIVTRGTLTQKILWWIFLTLGSSLGVDIFKLLHHSLTRDPFLTIFND